MKNIILFLFLIFTVSVIVSCDGNDLSDTNVVKIPYDSLYFSCKIDGEAIVIQSPSASLGGESVSIARFRRIINNATDSVIYGTEREYWTDNYAIYIGYSMSLLLDTTLIDNFAKLDLKSELYKTGVGSIRFYSPLAETRGLISYNSGFYIKIYDIKTQMSYTSYVEKNNFYDSMNLYDAFYRNSSFKIVSSRLLNVGTESDFKNAWFLESNFECTLFAQDTTNLHISIPKKKITEGVIRGCF